MMATPYTVFFTFVPNTGTPTSITLGGTHRATFSGVTGPLDVSLVENPNPGQPQGTLSLTVTCGGQTGPRSNVAGTWPYEVIMAHRKQTGEIDQAVDAAGSHFFTVSAPTSNLDMALDELVPQGGLVPRLFFTFTDA